MKEYGIGLLLFILAITQTIAQDSKNLFVTLMSETTTHPFTTYAPIHPGLEIGVSLWQFEKEKSSHQLNVFVGGFHHEKSENAFYLRGEYQYQLKLKQLIGIGFPVGGGYMHNFYPGQLYEQNEVTGEFEELNQIGRPHALMSAGVQISYIKTERFEPFLRHESVVDLPLAGGFANLYTFVKLGIAIRL